MRWLNTEKFCVYKFTSAFSPHYDILPNKANVPGEKVDEKLSGNKDEFLALPLQKARHCNREPHWGTLKLRVVRDTIFETLGRHL